MKLRLIFNWKSKCCEFNHAKETTEIMNSYINVAYSLDEELVEEDKITKHPRSIQPSLHKVLCRIPVRHNPEKCMVCHGNLTNYLVSRQLINSTQPYCLCNVMLTMLITSTYVEYTIIIADIRFCIYHSTGHCICCKGEGNVYSSH